MHKFMKTAGVAAVILLIGLLSACGRQRTARLHPYRYRQSNLTQLDRHVERKAVQPPRLAAKSIQTLPGHKSVWDAWPVTDANHDAVDYQGYNLMFAMVDRHRPRIHVFYRRLNSSNQTQAWHDAGPALTKATEGAASTGAENRRWLKRIRTEGAGSATRNGLSHVRLFYTGITARPNDHRSSDQLIATVKLHLRPVHHRIRIVHSDSTDHHVIRTANGHGYQTYGQYRKVFRSQSKWGTDPNKWQFINRDPHYVESYGKKYLVFESSVPVHRNSSVLDLDYNAEIGMVRLNRHYQVAHSSTPLVTFSGIAHEAGRPVLFQRDGYWYLFCDVRTDQLSNAHWLDHRYSMLLGFRAKRINGPYRPLNNRGGLVLSAKLDPRLKDFVYSYLPLDSGNHHHLVTGTYFMDAKRQTLAPSFRLKINGQRTTTLPEKVYSQGSITK